MRGKLIAALSITLTLVPAGGRSEPSHGWTARHGSVDGEDGYDVAVSPAGDRVYVTGSVEPYLGPLSPRTGSDWVTVAFDAFTGQRTWAAEHDGPAREDDLAWAVTTTPDGATVLVAGQTRSEQGNDATVIAYDAIDGDMRWVTTIDGHLDRTDEIFDTLAVTPDGSTVLAVGNADSRSPSIPGWYYELDLLIVALVVESGEVAWHQRRDGSGHDLDHATDVEISSDGTMAAVVAQSVGTTGSMEALTLLLDVEDGATRWFRETDVGGGYDIALTVLFGPGDSSLYVGGTSDGSANVTFVQRIEAGAGTASWLSLVPSVTYSENVLAISPGAESLYVVGGGRRGWLVSGLRTHDGSAAWSTSMGRYGSAVDVDVLADGTVVVAGTTAEDFSPSGFDIATIGVAPTDGAIRWIGTYDGGLADDRARALAVAPDGRRSFTVGESWGWPTTSFDLAVVAHGPGCADGTREEGPVSRPIDLFGEPQLPLLHEVNCRVIAPAGL